MRMRIINKDNPWQLVKIVKRRTTFRDMRPLGNNIYTGNRYNCLTNLGRKMYNHNYFNATIPKSPPIFIYGVTDYSSVITKEGKECIAKSLVDNTLKINAISLQITSVFGTSGIYKGEFVSF